MAKSTRADEPVETAELEEIVVEKGINRCNTVRKGGRLFGYSAIVVVGNRKGKAGFGFGKAREVPVALEKAGKRARKNLRDIPLKGDTIPHTVWGKFGAAKVLLKPAGGGTGIVAGGAVRAVVELAGVRNILTKSLGSNNAINLIKATFDGLSKLRSKEEVERLRGVRIGK